MPEEGRRMHMQPRLLLILCLLALLSATVQSSAVATDAAKAEGQFYVAPKDLAQRLGLEYQLEPVTGRVIFLRGGEPVVVLAPRMAYALVGDRLVELTQPGIEAYEGRYVTPAAVAEELARQLPQPSVTARPKGNWKVVIDPGHGGNDPGAIGARGTMEKDVNLGIALKLRRILKEKGYEVVMTRENDEFISLEERAEISRREAPDAFISIHANSADSPSASGVETYYITQKVDDSARAKSATLPAEGQEKFMGTSSVPTGQARTALYTVLYEQLRRDSVDLGQSIQKEMSKSLTASPNRGVKEANLHVLRGAICPAVLVETEFLSNPSNETLLSSSYFQEKVAGAVAAGIVRYFQEQ